MSRTSTLIIHKAVDREQLSKVVTPCPTGSFTPISHINLVAQVQNALEACNMRIANERHGLSPDSQRYFGVLDVTNGAKHEDYGYTLGLRNSHDKRFPAGLVVGSTVFVCQNLSFSGEIQIARKHTKFLMRDFPGLVANAIGRLYDKWHDQERRFEAYKSFEVTNPQVHDIVIRALDAGALTTTQIPHILKEYRDPRHAEFNESTVWSLFNAITQVAKGTPLPTLSYRTQSLHAVLDAEVGMEIETNPVVVQQDGNTVPSRYAPGDAYTLNN